MILLTFGLGLNVRRGLLKGFDGHIRNGSDIELVMYSVDQ